MKTPLRNLAVAAAALMTAAGVWVSPAGSQDLGNRLKSLGKGLPSVSMPGGGFSVDGKKGPYLQQIAGRPLEQNTASAGALSLASEAINQGAYQTARIRMPETEARLLQLVAKAEARWPYARRGPARVYMLGLTNYGAQSLPDGSIVIPFGLIDQATSDDEILFVLSHELAHIRLGHFAKAAKLREQRQMTAKLAQAYSIGSALASTRYQGGTISTDQAAAAQGARRASATRDSLNLLLNVLVEPAWGRRQEDEADAIGFDLTEAATYGAEAASARVFDQLQADHDRRKAMAEALQTQMQESLGVALRNAPTATGDAGNMLNAVNKDLQRGLREKGLAMASSFFAQKHRTPAQRKKGIADYSLAAYPAGLPLRDEQTAWLKPTRATREYAQAKMAVTAVSEAMRLRGLGQYPAAEREIAKALATSFGIAPLVLNEAARVARDAGQNAKADQYWRKAHASQDQTLDGYVEHANFLIATSQYAQATTIVTAGIGRFGNDDKPFLPAMIAIAFRTGDNAKGSKLLQRCVDYEDPTLKNDCILAAVNPSNPQAYDRMDPATRASVDASIRKATSTTPSFMPNLQGLMGPLQQLIGD